MRVISIILAILVLFLTVQPVCGVPSSAIQADACCSAGCTEGADDEGAGKNEHKEDCSICNPFQSCACCAGYVSTPQAVYPNAIAGIYYAPATWDLRAAQLIEAPLDGFWQPPKA